MSLTGENFSRQRPPPRFLRPIFLSHVQCRFPPVGATGILVIALNINGMLSKFEIVKASIDTANSRLWWLKTNRLPNFHHE